MTSFSKQFRFAIWLGVMSCCILPTSCQRKPALAPSADPFSAIEPPPMGGTTYNDELKRELAILSAFLDNKIDTAQVLKVKTALMSGKAETLSQDKTSDESYLVKVLLTLPELVHMSEPPSNNRKLWLTGKYYFLKRRFVEAAINMTEVIKHEPNFVDARNWRARAIFFLGNPDLAIAELNVIITKSPPKSAEALDALYLVGAIVYESNDNEQKRLITGINAWQRYLEIADPTPDMKTEITQSLAELHNRKDGTIKPHEIIDPFTPNDSFGPEKNAVLVAFAKEELDLAMDMADRYLKKNYDNTVATLKARILFKKGRLDDAAELFLAIVTKDKNYAPGFHYQGMAFMLKGEPEHAIASWSKAMEADPVYANSHGLMQRIAVAKKMVGEKSGGT